jgi:non-canonical (house-cleaning) NTP pyrophosphatase
VPNDRSIAASSTSARRSGSPMSRSTSWQSGNRAIGQSGNRAIGQSGDRAIGRSGVCRTSLALALGPFAHDDLEQSI